MRQTPGAFAPAAKLNLHELDSKGFHTFYANLQVVPIVGVANELLGRHSDAEEFPDMNSVNFLCASMSLCHFGSFSSCIARPSLP